jgi:lipopolysaccharide/colanic/teichoic acid biosynthesis glycosyltransferase
VNHPDEKLQVRSHTSVAVNPRVLSYGTADAVLTLPRPLQSPPITGRLKFFVGELTGVLFIIISTLFIFLVPAALAGQGALKATMNRLIKRTLDVIGGVVGLVLVAPLMLLVGAAIKLDSPGPVFYTQLRVGVNRRKTDRRYCRRIGVVEMRQRDRRREDYLGRPFQIVKFRTMVQDAEKHTGPVWATRDDTRVTRVGRVLRKTRLDEVPQFWSVLKGDMSLVGPRPERPIFVRQLSERVEDYHRRLEVKPGLTGLAQVENGYDSSVSSVTDKVRFDIKYISSWSFWTDLRILFKTVVVVVTGKGAC